MRKQSQELVLRSVRRNQLLPLPDIVRFIFHEIKNALNRLLRILQTQEIDIHEVRGAVTILQRLFDQLKRRTEGKDFIDRLRRRDFHVGVGRVGEICLGREVAESFRHLSESFIRLQEAVCLGIDQRDAGGHIGEDFFVKNYFPLDALGRFALTAVSFARQPGENPS